MNADTCLVLLTPDQFGSEKARKISLRRKISLTRGASYKPPALPGDTYCTGLPPGPTSKYQYLAHLTEIAIEIAQANNVPADEIFMHAHAACRSGM
jgi:hypothetical protein